MLRLNLISWVSDKPSFCWYWGIGRFPYYSIHLPWVQKFCCRSLFLCVSCWHKRLLPLLSRCLPPAFCEWYFSQILRRHPSSEVVILQTQLHVYDTHLANPKLKLHELSDEAGLSVNKLVNYYDEDGELAGAQTVDWLSRNGYELDAKEGEAIIKRRKRQIARQHLEAAKEYIVNVQLGKFPLRKR